MGGVTTQLQSLEAALQAPQQAKVATGLSHEALAALDGVADATERLNPGGKNVWREIRERVAQPIAGSVSGRYVGDTALLVSELSELCSNVQEVLGGRRDPTHLLWFAERFAAVMQSADERAMGSARIRDHSLLSGIPATAAEVAARQRELLEHVDKLMNPPVMVTDPIDVEDMGVRAEMAKAAAKMLRKWKL